MTDTSEAAQHRHDYERGANPPPIDTRSVAEIELAIRRDAINLLIDARARPLHYCISDRASAVHRILQSFAREAADAKAREQA